MFELQHVSRRFGETLAVAGVSLTIGEGRTTVLLGPSGCGKSTVLRLMLGLLTPSKGTVCYRGEPVTAARAADLRCKLGYVPQGGGLFPHLTAAENACLVARQLRWPDSEIQSRLAARSELTRVAPELWDRYPVQLSGGQQQRVALLRALMLDPEVLLLDEPLGALDPMVRADLQDELAQLFLELKQTVVLVTHDLREAALLGQHVVLMRDGLIVQQGAFDDLDRSPVDRFVTRFLQAQREPGKR